MPSSSMASCRPLAGHGRPPQPARGQCATPSTQRAFHGLLESTIKPPRTATTSLMQWHGGARARTSSKSRGYVLARRPSMRLKRPVRAHRFGITRRLRNCFHARPGAAEPFTCAPSAGRQRAQHGSLQTVLQSCAPTPGPPSGGPVPPRTESKGAGGASRGEVIGLVDQIMSLTLIEAADLSARPPARPPPAKPLTR